MEDAYYYTMNCRHPQPENIVTGYFLSRKAIDYLATGSIYQHFDILMVTKK